MALEILQWVFIAILLVLPLLYELNGTFKYYAKIFLYYLSVQIVAMGVLLCSLWRPGDVENFRYVVISIKELRKVFGIDIEVRGREHLKGSEPCIIVANHQTSLDFFGMMEVWPDRCVPLAKKELRYMFTFGLAAILTGTIFIDRSNREKALSTMEEAAAVIHSKKLKVFIFPEGTRNHDGGVLPFKKGAFHLAVQAQVPIIPVVFSSYNDFYNKREKRFDTGKLTITCLPPVSTEGMKQSDVSVLSERVREQILEVFNQSSAEVRQPKLTNGLR